MIIITYPLHSALQCHTEKYSRNLHVVHAFDFQRNKLGEHSLRHG